MNICLSRPLSIALLTLTSTALADSTAPRGWFLEANAIDVESSGEQNAFVFDGDESGAYLAGGYAFSRVFALQGGYYRFGDHAASDCPSTLVCTAVLHDDVVDLEGVSLAAIGSWRVTDTLELYGKLGVLAWDADFTVTGGDKSGRDAIAGVGVGIWVSPQWRLNLLYERVDFDLESAGLGMTFRF